MNNNHHGRKYCTPSTHQTLCWVPYLTLLAEMAAVKPMPLFKFKLTETKPNQNFSYSVVPTTFQAPHSHMWLGGLPTWIAR